MKAGVQTEYNYVKKLDSGLRLSRHVGIHRRMTQNGFSAFYEHIKIESDYILTFRIGLKIKAKIIETTKK